MALNINHELKMLQRMTVTELRAKYQEVFGEVARSHNKTHLWKRIAWRLQALEEGDLSERARRRAQELARDADIRIRPPRGTFGPQARRFVGLQSYDSVVPQNRRPSIPWAHRTTIPRTYNHG